MHDNCKILKKLKFEQLTAKEQAVLPDYIDRKSLRRVFYTSPMFPFEKVADQDISHDLMFEIQMEEYPFLPEKSIKNSNVEKFYAFVYNCVAPDCSEIGSVYVDFRKKVRLG